MGSDGKPIAGALLSVSTSRPGAEPRAHIVRTRAGGTYSRDFRWGASRMIVVRWYLLGDSTRAVSSRSVRLLGEARVTLNVAPVRPRNGHALILTGEVVGARRGTRIVTRVRAGPYGRTFLALAVDQHGRYRGRRTLTDSAGVVYCLRAVALSQPNFAYAAGHSRVVCRRVRR